MNIQKSFEDTIRGTDLQGIGIDLAEATIDSFLHDDVIKEIPIIGTIAGLLKVGANIHDRLFLMKIVSFLKPLADIPPEKRRSVIDQLDSSKQYRVKVGEKLLYIIDSCEDYEISELVSRVFKYYIEGNSTYDEFLTTSSVLKDMNKIDFDRFIKADIWHLQKLNRVADLIHTGLFELHYADVKVKVMERDWKLPKPLRRSNDSLRHISSESPYETEVNGGVEVTLSTAGRILREVFTQKPNK